MNNIIFVLHQVVYLQTQQMGQTTRNRNAITCMQRKVKGHVELMIFLGVHFNTKEPYTIYKQNGRESLFT